MPNKQITILGQTFISGKEAAKHFNLSYSTFRKRLYKYSLDDPRLVAKPQPTHGRKIKINQHEFNNLQETADYFHITKNTLVARLSRGEDPNDIYTYRPEGSNQKQAITYHGKKYKSIRQLSLQTGIGEHTIRQTLDKKESLDNLKPANNPTAPQGFTYKGVYYKSKQEAADKHNLSSATITRRLSQPDALERDDLFAPVGKYQRSDRKKITYQGKTYPSIRAMAKENGLTPSCLSARIRREGLYSPFLLRPARETISKHNKKPVVILGIYYESITQAAKENGFRADTLWQRLQKYDHNDPRILQPLQTPKDYMAKEITYRGHKFDSIKDMAKHYHIHSNAILARMRHYGHNDPRVVEHLGNATKEHLRIK